MEKKAISIWLALLLVGTIFTVLFVGSVSAANDDHNLSGIIWKADGTAPSVSTEFCIWVEHPATSGMWERFPDTGWAMTDDDIDGLWWYSYVLPQIYKDLRWGDTDTYRVEVNGGPWGEFFGNTTSNGTGSVPDPVPPFDPMSILSTYNTINYSAGGGFDNEQQWDVRTQAPQDIAPTNVTVDGLRPVDYPAGIPVAQSTLYHIFFNVTNFGLLDPGTFWVTLWNCSVTGQNFGFSSIITFQVFGLPVGGDIQINMIDWLAPIPPGDYYINITVDSLYEVPEFNEVNNTYILHLKNGPDLIVTDVFVNSVAPADPIYVGPGELVQIDASSENIGYSSAGGQTWMAIYDLMNPGGPMVPGSEDEIQIGDLIPGETSPPVTWFWTVPWDAGDYYVNISADFRNETWEASETNNNYMVHFAVEPDLVPNNVRGDGVPVVGYIKLPPLQSTSIGVNASNIGNSSTGVYTFSISYTNCTSVGAPTDPTFFTSSIVGPVPVGGFSIDVFADWIMPDEPSIFDYFIRIEVDPFISYNNVSEINESNNVYILHIVKDAPDLTFDDLSVEVMGISVVSYPDPATLPTPFVSDIPVEVPVGQPITIKANVINLGGEPMPMASNVTFYEVSGVGGPPIASPFAEPVLPILISGGSIEVSGIWPDPGFTGIYYIDIKIDFNFTTDDNGIIVELNEDDNTFHLILNVTPEPITIMNSTAPTLINTTLIRYIDSTTELNFTAIGENPPFYTWYRIIDMETGFVVQGWENYTGNGGVNFTITFGESTYKIEYNSTDVVGAEETTKYRIVIVDDSVPESYISIGNPRYRIFLNNWNITSSTPITLSAEDNPPGTSISGPDNAAGLNKIDEAGIFYRIQRVSDGAWVQDWTKSNLVDLVGGIYTASAFTLPSAWSDGYYRIWFNATDNLGHMETTDYTEVYLDNTGPITSIVAGTPKVTHPIYDWYVTSLTDFTLSATETIGAGVDTSTLQYRITYVDTGQSTLWTPYIIPFTMGSTLSLGDGHYTIQFNSQDNLGNTGPIGTMDIYVDDTPPDATLNLDIPKFRANATQRWNITDLTNISIQAGDGIGSGVDTINYRIINSTTTWPWVTYTAIFNLLSRALDDGIYTIEYSSNDNLGNYQSFNESIYLDNTPPDITISDPIGIRYRDDPLHLWNITDTSEFTLSADDGEGCGVNASLTQYRVYNASYNSGWIQYSGAFALPAGLSDGIYTIEFESADYLGNTQPDSTDVRLENSGPVTVITGGQINWNTDQNAWEVDFSTFFTLTADDGPGSGVDFIEYRIRIDATTWTTWQNATGDTVQFNLTEQDHGTWDHTIEFRATDYMGNLGPTDNLEIYIEGDITPPYPPLLRLRLTSDEDVELYWEPSDDLDVDHYLIFRTTSKTGFNFTDIWIDTSAVPDPLDLTTQGLRTSWNHTGALIGDESEAYYSIRGVDALDNTGYTSNIVGWVTLTFEEGYNTFSLPLEPFTTITASDMIGDAKFVHETDAMYRYDSESQQWIGKPKYLPSPMDNFDLEMGEGYMLFINEEEVKYTFTGATGTAIRYKGGAGDEPAFRNSLTASKHGSSVDLKWLDTTNATEGYAIYKATSRMGEGSLTDYNNSNPIHTTSAGITSWTDSNATDDEYYYMVVAVDEFGEQSGTYAVGVKTYDLMEGYNLFSLELGPKTPQTLSSSTQMFTSDSSALYYYDKMAGTWIGHPKFLPENINDVEMELGTAYIAFVYDEGVSHSFSGV